MKIFLFAAIGGGIHALPVEGDELKAKVNFDYWARTSVTEHKSFGKKPSIGVSHGELPFVVYRLLKKSNVWASGHLLSLAQERFDQQSFDMESETLMLMSDLFDTARYESYLRTPIIPTHSRIRAGRVQRILQRLDSLADKGDELAELISAWSWASGPIKIKSAYAISNLNSQKTENGAQRLRGIRADLLTLLANVPDETFNSPANPENVSDSLTDFSGDGSGDSLEDQAVELIYSPDVVDQTKASSQQNHAYLVRHGLVENDDSLFDGSNNQNLGENIITDDVITDEVDMTNQRAFGLFDKVKTLVGDLFF